MTMVKSIGLFSALKVGFVMYALPGLILGVICSAIAFAGVPFGPHAHTPLKGVLAIMPVFLCPLFYGIAGALASVLGAVFYNFAAGLMGGLEVEVR
jgi:hypothetical protein